MTVFRNPSLRQYQLPNGARLANVPAAVGMYLLHPQSGRDEVRAMDGTWQRFADNLITRLGAGPMHFRLFLQPAMAFFFGIRDGLKDARGGKPAYFWSMFTGSQSRAELLREGFKAVGRVLALAIVMEVIYQIIVFHTFYPGEAITVALILAFVPYLFVRGPANRVARWWATRHAASAHPRKTSAW
jgi:hypothetical protein